MNLFGIPIRVSDHVRPVPRIQVRDIKFKDGTSILSQEFLTSINASLAEEFGYNDVAYLISGPFGDGIVMHPRQFAMLKL